MRKAGVRLGAAVLIGILAASQADAQVVNFRHYTSAEGMPQAQVLGLTQDGRGYIWFATYGGLSRFDGSNFHTYERRDGLNSSSVFDVTEDRRGRLLVATSRGVCILEHGQFTCYGQRDGLFSDNARSVAADAEDGVWVGTARGISHVRNRVVRNYTTADGLPAEWVHRVAVDSKGDVWAATDGGLARLDDGRFVLQSPDVIGQRAVQFVTSAGDRVLVGAGHQLYLREGGTFTPVVASEIPADVTFTDGTVEQDGTIWLTSRSGVLRIRDGRVDRFGRQNGLLSELVNRVMIDRQGVVWFGTESGASKHVPGPFRTYTPSEGLPSPFVRAIATDAEGRLWTGGRNGVAVRQGERFAVVPLPGVPDNRVYALARNPEGGMLIGTRKGLVAYRAGRLRRYTAQDGLPGEVVFALADDGAGGLWIGTNRGLARWHRGQITAQSGEAANLSIVAMLRDSRGRLWLSRSQGGLVMMDRGAVHLLGEAEHASDETVWSVQEDAQGRIWAGTNGDGVLRIDPDGRIHKFTINDGLASNFIWQVLLDRRGDAWVFGNLGLNRFSGDTLTHYARGSGLMDLEGSAGAAHEDPEGNLWFGTGSGVIRFTAGLERLAPVAPPVYIEAATNDAEPFPTAASGGEARLPRGVVRITFASPSFRDESAIRFRYRLAGADDRWSSPTADRTITYAGLSPGLYRFEVMAVDGRQQSATPAQLAFRVMPSYWQTWWFRLAIVGLLLGAVTLVPVLRARALDRERLRLEAVVASHTRELAEKNARLESSNKELEYFAYIASHDLQEPLRKIQAFSDRVTKQYAERLDDPGRDYLARMSAAAARMQRLIEDLLSLSRVSTKKGRIETLDLRALVQDVLTDLEFRLQSTQGRVEIGDMPHVTGDPVQIRQLFQNLVGNALKFHRPDVPPVVTITARHQTGTMLEITVEDNGIGFEAKDAERVFRPFQRLHGRGEYEGTGIGLTICQKIVERHGGAIRAEASPNRGSRFILTLPVADVSAGVRDAA